MTTRPRTSGLDALRRQSLRPYYEPFTPRVEESNKDEAHVLQLELPDFNVQQVRVKIEEATRTVVVTGDRYVGNNKWLRLDKTYSAPENCVVEKIYHEFHDGILTITMPKKTLPQRREDDATQPDRIGNPKEYDSKTSSPSEDDELKPPENGRKNVSQEDATRPDPKPETKAPKEAPPKDDYKPSSVEKPTEDDELKSAEAADKVNEDQQPPLLPKQEGQKINSSDQNPTESKEDKEKISEKEDKNSETKEEESKTEEPLKNTESGTPRGIRALVPTLGFAIGKLPLPLKANLAATVVIVAAYYAYTYFQLPAN